jgi:hypothetical protein
MTGESLRAATGINALPRARRRKRDQVQETSGEGRSLDGKSRNRVTGRDG